ncbi:hypothetical protein OIU85_016816 [Salix viminalis]|uniref:Uncharacterized protein n=1 Tax=Salix viminalis TaxID=40686 RepID=A0A9Q0ZQ83_SALVM|nr:hypothetical protein OIU85_016816 [Salix viminalis]
MPSWSGAFPGIDTHDPVATLKGLEKLKEPGVGNLMRLFESFKREWHVTARWLSEHDSNASSGFSVKRPIWVTTASP